MKIVGKQRAAETVDSTAERVVRVTAALLVDQGPSGIRARTVAKASGLSTTVVYHHFGGMQELMKAVVDYGFSELDRALAVLPETDDPVTDLFNIALTTRRIAFDNPHLYDQMFGLSTRATYRPATDTRPSGHSPAFRTAHQRLISACGRVVESGRIQPASPVVVAAAVWSLVHGYITLELSEHFSEFDDPVQQVLLPMGVTFTVGLGDRPQRAQASLAAATQRFTAKRMSGTSPPPTPAPAHG